MVAERPDTGQDARKAVAPGIDPIELDRQRVAALAALDIEPAEVASISPAMVLTSVVLPTPLRPTSASTSPASTSSVTSRTIGMPGSPRHEIEFKGS